MNRPGREKIRLYATIRKEEQQMKHKRKSPTASTTGKPMEAAMALTDMQAAKTDPQGSYTGVAEQAYEKPVQDADDL